MIGTVNLNRDEIKKFMLDYFAGYKDIKVYFKEPCGKTGTGIVVSYSHEIKNGASIKIEEELETEDIKELFTNVFKEKGYEATNVYLDTKQNGEGYGEYTSLERIKVQLHKKEKVKQKTL